MCSLHPSGALDLQHIMAPLNWIDLNVPQITDGYHDGIKKLSSLRKNWPWTSQAKHPRPRVTQPKFADSNVKLGEGCRNSGGHVEVWFCSREFVGLLFSCVEAARCRAKHSTETPQQPPTPSTASLFKRIFKQLVNKNYKVCAL